jgi:tripartite ATP-independent transporter DctM subunit
MSILIGFLALLVTLFMGIPIPFAFFASAFVLMAAHGYDPGFLISFGFSKMKAPVLLTIPLFIMAGAIMDKGRIGDKMVDVADVFLGRIRGGLGVVLIAACAVFGSVTGSCSATVSCIGSILMPRLKRAGYPLGHSAAFLANAGVLGLLIPPSIIMILYAWQANVSVLACFMASVLPGIFLAILMAILNVFLLRNNKSIQLEESYDFGTTMKLFGRRSTKASPALMMPVIILGGIYGGFMTPTESAAVAVVYAIPLAVFFYKGIKLKELWPTLIDSAITSGVIMVMLFAVMILSRIYIMEDLHTQILELLRSISENKYVILLLINLALIGFGMLMDDVSSCLLATPIFLPIVKELGIDPVHFAAIIGVNLGLGNVTPPTAPMIYLAGRMSNATFNQMLKPTLLIIAFCWVPTLIITTYVPSVPLFLVNLLLH